ncbi:winged helix-turn-helix domain-containing protein [Roseburia intestinalis]
MGNRTNYGTGRMTVDNRQKNERSRSGNPYSSHVKAGKHAGTVYNFKRKSRIRKSLTRLPILLEFIHKYIFLNFVSFYNGLNSNEILLLLAQNAGMVFSKEKIYNIVWKEPYFGDYNIVMSHIRNLRGKIEDNPSKPIYIQTVWGVGYRFNKNLSSGL